METKAKSIDQFLASLDEDFGGAYKSTAQYIHKFLEALKKDGYQVILSRSVEGEIACTTSLEAVEAIHDAHSATILLNKGRTGLSIDFTMASDNEESVTDYSTLRATERETKAIFERIDEIRKHLS